MISRKIILTFPQTLLDKPIVYRLIKDYDLIFNILQAKVTPDEEGIMILEIKGSSQNYNAGIDYLKNLGIDIKPLKKKIIWSEESCTHCGLCIDICPTKALGFKKPQMKIEFDKSK
jgi:ferredoxin